MARGEVGISDMDGMEFDWRREAWALGSVASAVSMAMFAQLAIDAVETAVVARLGAVALAGVTLALGVHGVIFLFALGVVTAVTPLAAHAAGQGDAEAVRRIGQNGLWVALAVAIPLAGAMLAVALLLPARGPEMREAAHYIAGAAWGLPGWVGYVAIRSLAIATGRVRVATAIMLVAVPAHALLAVMLVFGMGWGTFGAGLAYALTAYTALGALAVILALSNQGALSAALRGPPVVDWATCRAILHLGLPFALRIVLREAVLPVSAFGLIPFGAAAVAAHGVASRVVMLAGVFSYGFSDAANLHVGRAIGAGALDRARRAAWLAVALALVVSVAVAGVVGLDPRSLAAFVLGAGNAAVPAASRVLPLAAVLLALEGVQSAGSGALSGLRDARVPLAIAVLGGWLVGIPMGFILAARMEPAVGLWTGLCAGWLVAMALTLTRLRHRLPR